MLLTGKVVLISGGAGSLGQAITNALLKTDVKAIRILDNGEFFEWDMQRRNIDSRLRYLLGDIRDKDRLYRAMNGVDIVFHAAALKHVSLCEYNPIEAVKTNILGAINIIDAALDNRVEKVLAFSSDKAVHPINLYGATKLVMEKLIVQANVYQDTMFSCIRPGNFWGSRGSLVPLIEEQVKNGKKITITNKEMTRFWITFDNISRFSLLCLDKMEGGEIFIPKMPETAILDTIRLLAPDSEIEIIGKRVGEKLHEMLFSEGETPEDKGDYYLIKTEF